MVTICKKVDQLIKEGVLFPPIDGNHGEKHPKSSDFVDDGIPFILVPDLKDGHVDLENCNYISKAQANTLSKGFSVTGDVLFTHKGTIGKVAIVDTGKYDFIILTPQVTYYRIKNQKILSNRYLYYYFLSQTFQNTFQLYASAGGTRDYLGIVAQQKLPIIYPDIDRQNKIADVLQSYDRLIGINHKRIKVLEQMAENLYKEWFVRFRFPGHESVPFENGLPKGWKIKRVDAIGEVIGGGTPSTNVDSFWDGTIPWLTPADLSNTNRILIRRGSTNISSEGLKRSGATMMPPGTVLVSSRAPVGYLAIAANPICTNQGFKSIVCFEGKTSPYYLFFFLRSNREMLQNYATGATFPELSGNRMKKIKILVPDYQIQHRFEMIAKEVICEMDKLEEANDLLKHQRDLLLPRLMSGKLEV